MSKKRNRAKLNKAKSSKEYSAIQLNIAYPIYWDDGILFKGRLMSFEQRMCRTWKHNRKTQWKY